VPFTRAADLRTFESGAAPRAHVGERWLHFEAHARLYGVVLWGTPNAEQTRRLVDSLRLELRDEVTPHHSIVDVSRLESVDGGAFEALNNYVVDEREPLSKAVTRLALVRPRGMAGAVASGFFEVLEAPYPVELFDGVPQALAWLGEDAALAEELGALIDEVTGTSPLLAQLVAAMEEDLRAASPALVAKALGLSERTLQRRLKQEGTTFAAQLAQARLRSAQKRMRESDEPLASIALDAGYSSQQHLSRAFKEALGMTPSAWRDREP
jgi:AraC-like DNA-binding protein